MHSYVVYQYGYLCFKNKTCKPKETKKSIMSLLLCQIVWTIKGLLIDPLKKALNYVIKLEALIKDLNFLHCVYAL